MHKLPNQPASIRDDALYLIPETAQELDDLERSRLYLTSVGCPLELWEILLLTQSGAWDLQHRTAPQAGGSDPTPARALRYLRESEGRFIRDLRFFLERIAAPAEIARAEIVIGAIAASRRNRAAALRWLAPAPEPDLAGYAIVMRSTTSAYWEREIYVGNVTEYTLPDVSIDEVVFGVTAVDRDGNESLVSAYVQAPRQRRTIATY